MNSEGSTLFHSASVAPSDMRGKAGGKEDTEEAAKTFVTSTELFKLAESLGGIKSLISHPATMTHKTIPVEKRKKAGVADSLIRLSTGLEDTEDLLEDLRQALEKTAAAKPIGRVLQPEGQGQHPVGKVLTAK